MALRGYGKRSLKTIPGQLTRPTAARVREAVFNIWRDRVPGCRWLDLCAGTGSMGAEALGRGAAIAVAVEQSGRACGVIRHNWQLMTHDSPIQITVIRSEVLTFLQRFARCPGDLSLGQNRDPSPEQNPHPAPNLASNPASPVSFDLIYFDPPYACGWYDPVIQAIAQTQILAPEGELAVEHNPKFWTPAAIVPRPAPPASPAHGSSALVLHRQKAYGNTHLAFYRWSADSISPKSHQSEV